MIIRTRRVRTALAALAMLLPAGFRRFVHCRLLGYEIDPTATVGHAFVDVGRLRMGPGSRVASLSAVRGCDDVELGPEASIAALTLVNAVRSGSRYFAGQDRHPALIMKRGASITSFHIVDCCATVTLEDFADLGGFGSQIMTHSIDLLRVQQVARPVTLGHHCMLGTRVVILAGTELPACSVVSAGSVVAPESVREGQHLYSGVPAEPRRDLNPRIPYFHHEQSDIL